jgi:hypothetical protein
MFIAFIERECMTKKIKYMGVFFLGVTFWVSSCLEAANLDGRTGTSIYQSTQWAPSGGDFARGFVCLDAGFVIPASVSINLNVLMPVSGNIDLGGTGKFILEGDLTLASGAAIVQGGLVDGQDKTIFLKNDLIIPAGESITFVSNTVIDGQGHEIIFEEGSYFKIDGLPSTNLTLKNCILRGVQDYDSGKSIVFGTSFDQNLVLNNIVLNLKSDFTFDGGGLVIENLVRVKGQYWFFYFDSEYDLNIRQDSTLFLDTNVIFAYTPADNSPRHLIMEDDSSELFFNGCLIYLPDTNGLQLIKGHLLIDHKTELYSSGSEKKALAMTWGDGINADNLSVDIFPGANFDVTSGGLIYANKDEISF